MVGLQTVVLKENKTGCSQDADKRWEKSANEHVPINLGKC